MEAKQQKQKITLKIMNKDYNITKETQEENLGIIKELLKNSYDIKNIKLNRFNHRYIIINLYFYDNEDEFNYIENFIIDIVNSINEALQNRTQEKRIRYIKNYFKDVYIDANIDTNLLNSDDYKTLFTLFNRFVGDEGDLFKYIREFNHLKHGLMSYTYKINY
jgi:hypothetical protein